MESLWLAQARAAVANGWRYRITKAAPTSDIYGTIYDNADTFVDQTDYSNQPVALRISKVSEDVNIQEGDYLTVTYDGDQTVNIYPPALSGDIDTYYFIRSDGSTYNDQWLCEPAKLVPTLTPTATP